MKTNKEAQNYLIFGGLTMLTNWLVYSLVVGILGYGINSGNVISWMVAVLFAFITNKIWVFGQKDWQPAFVIRQFSTFLGARLFSGGFELLALPLIMDLGLSQPLFGIEGFAAKIAVSGAVIVINYVFSKRFVFKQAD